MIERIVSGGQTGVDRGALDAALAAGFPCGGWCPRGRRAEDGAIPPRYPLAEAPGTRYAERTRLNVRDSDGTLILTWGTPSGGTRTTAAHAARLARPCLVIDLAAADDEAAAAEAAAWAATHDIRTLNVAGPRASQRPEACRRARNVVAALLGLRRSETGAPAARRA